MFYNVPPDKAPEAAPQPTPEHLVDAAFSFAQRLLATATPPAVVEKELVDAGFGADLALAVVAELAANQTKRGRRRTRRTGSMASSHVSANPARFAHAPTQDLQSAGKTNMLVGGLVCAAGIVITVASLAAAQGGGSYVIAWGAIVFGFIQFVRGASQASGQ